MNIDELNIKISSNAKSAKNGLDSLTTALKGISQIDTSNITALISGLEALTSTLRGSSKKDNSGMTETENGVKKLRFSVENATPKIAELKQQLKDLSKQGLSFGDEEFDTVYTELKQNQDALKDYKKTLNELDSSGKAISEIPKSAISEEQLKRIDEIVDRIVADEERLAQASQTVDDSFKVPSVDAPSRFVYDPTDTTGMADPEGLLELRRSLEAIDEELTDVGKDSNNVEQVQGSFARVRTTLDSLKKDINEAKPLTDQFLSGLSKVGNAVDNGMITAYNSIGKVFLAIDKFNKPFEALFQKASSVFKRIKNSVGETDIKAKLKEAFSLEGIERGMARIDGFFGKITAGAKGIGRIVLSSIGSGFRGAISHLREFVSNFSKTHKPTINLKKSLKSVGTVLKSLAKLGGKFASSLASGAKKALTGGIRPLSKGLGRVKNMFKNMLVRSVLYSGMSAIREGFAGLAKEDKRFNKSMSSMYSALMTLKNAFVASFAPIVETVEPYITKLLNMLTAVITKVSQLVSALTGSKTVTVAKKLTLDYADAVDESTKSTKKATKANKEYQNSVQGFDELNKLNGNKSSDTDDTVGSEFNTEFETGDANELANKIKEAWKNADFTDIGEMISSKIVAGLNSINWENIKEKAEKVGKSFATLVNGLFSFSDKDGNTLGTTLGKTIGEAFNTAINFVYGFVHNLEWGKIGTEIGKSIDTLFNTIDWKKAGATLSDGIKGALELVTKAIQNVDWAKLARDLVAFVKAIDWSGIADNLFEGLGSALGGICSFVGQLLVDGFNGIKNFFSKEIDDAGGNVAEGILNGIIHGFQAIGTWIYDHILKPFVDGFKKTFKIHSPSKVTEELGGYLSDGIKKGIGNIWSKVKEKFTEFVDKIKTWFSDKATSFKNRGKEIISSIKDGIGDVWEKVKGKFGAFYTGVKDWFAEKKEQFVSKGASVVSNIKNGLGNVWSSISSKFSTMWTNLSNWFTGKKENFKGLGSNLVARIKDGLGNIWNSLKQKFVDFWNSLKSYIGGKNLKLKVDWDTESTLGKALTTIGLKGMPKLSFYKDGGFPNVGELFVAREAGAEMVGSINNRPAVANNQQIEKALENAVARGLSSSQGNASPIYINVDVPLDRAILGQAMIDYHNGYVKTTGGSPLLIGG